MKKVLCLLLFLLLMIFSIGCGNESINTTADGNQIGKSNDTNKMLKDIDSVIEFVNTTDTNMMTDQHEKKLTVLENYETHYFDFTGEGNDDIAIVTWADDNSYLPVIFVTTDVTENEYYLINSDFRGNPGDEFFYEDNLIIKKNDSSKMYDFAYKMENKYIQMVNRYVPFGDITEVVQPQLDTKSILHYSLEKLDGFKKFNVNKVNTYFDEKGNQHKYEDITSSYAFNEDTLEFEIKETPNMKSIPLESLIEENFVIGNDASLKTFETLYEESDFETAVNYYYDNRQKFSKETRLNYLDSFFVLLGSINNDIYYIDTTDEVIKNNEISSVTVYAEKIPEKFSSAFSIVKCFNIEDGANPPDRIDSDGYYYMTCIKSDITNKIKLMSYDREVLKNELGEYYYSGMFDDLVSVEFKNQKQLLEDVENIVYPTVLIDNLSQLDKFKHKDIWKTNIVIEPKEIKYINIDEIYGEEDI